MTLALAVVPLVATVGAGRSPACRRPMWRPARSAVPVIYVLVRVMGAAYPNGPQAVVLGVVFIACAIPVLRIIDEGTCPGTATPAASVQVATDLATWLFVAIRQLGDKIAASETDSPAARRSLSRPSGPAAHRTSG